MELQHRLSCLLATVPSAQHTVIAIGSVTYLQEQLISAETPISEQRALRGTSALSSDSLRPDLASHQSAHAN